MSAVQVSESVVMVAEDEPLVRMLGAKVLTEAGFAVIEAPDAEKALALKGGLMPLNPV